MLDRARRTVLAIINKENRGYLTPAQSDLFFNQAQLEIFEDYFVMYAKWINKANQRLSNSGFSDMPKNIREKIDIFSTEGTLTYDGGSGLFSFPTDTYYINTVNYGTTYIDEVDKRKIKYLEGSTLIAPTEDNPVYTLYGRTIKVLPVTIVADVTCDYLRKPKVPKWTYTVISGNPVFNQSATDYQDLEIHPSDEPQLILKVLSYLGIHMREADVVKVMDAKENLDLAKNS